MVRLMQSLAAAPTPIPWENRSRLERRVRAGEIVFTGVGKTAPRSSGRSPSGSRRSTPSRAASWSESTPVARRERTRVALRRQPRRRRAEPSAHLDRAAAQQVRRADRGDARALFADTAAAGSQGRRRPRPRRLADHDAGPLSPAARDVIGARRGPEADGVPWSTSDLGGGLGISYDGAPEPTRGLRGRRRGGAVARTGLSLIVEPGRALVGAAPSDMKPSRRRRSRGMAPTAVRDSRCRDDRADAAGPLRRLPPHRGRRAGAGGRAVRDRWPRLREQRRLRPRPLLSTRASATSWPSSIRAPTVRRWRRTTTAGRCRRRCSWTGRWRVIRRPQTSTTWCASRRRAMPSWPV